MAEPRAGQPHAFKSMLDPLFVLPGKDIDLRAAGEAAAQALGRTRFGCAWPATGA